MLLAKFITSVRFAARQCTSFPNPEVTRSSRNVIASTGLVLNHEACLFMIRAGEIKITVYTVARLNLVTIIFNENLMASSWHNSKLNFTQETYPYKNFVAQLCY